jgi:20S proteasome alpha/beta subunit
MAMDNVNKSYLTNSKEILDRLYSSLYSVNYNPSIKKFIDVYGPKFAEGIADIHKRLQAKEQELNIYLEEFRMKTNNPWSLLKHTGTTLVGVVYKDGIMMGSDRKVVSGLWTYGLEDKKIDQLSPYIAIAGTGLVSEINLVKDFLKEYRNFFRNEYDEEINVEQMSKIYYWISSNVWYSEYIMGGFSDDGIPLLYDLGFIYREPVSRKANGSGGFLGHAAGILEADYKENMKEKEAFNLVIKALAIAERLDHFSGARKGEYQVIKIEKNRPIFEFPAEFVRAERLKYER